MFKFKKWSLVAITIIGSTILVPVIVACNSKPNKAITFNVQINDNKLYKNQDNWILNLNINNTKVDSLVVEIVSVDQLQKPISSYRAIIKDNNYQVVFRQLDINQTYQIKSIHINNESIKLSPELKQLKLKPHALSVRFRS